MTDTKKKKKKAKGDGESEQTKQHILYAQRARTHTYKKKTPITKCNSLTVFPPFRYAFNLFIFKLASSSSQFFRSCFSAIFFCFLLTAFQKKKIIYVVKQTGKKNHILQNSPMSKKKQPEKKKQKAIKPATLFLSRLLNLVLVLY